MRKTSFEWDSNKNEENQAKHSVSFTLAQQALLDPHRVIVEDLIHSGEEDRFYCVGRIGDGIMTVRFTYRWQCHPYPWCWLLEKREKDL